MKGDNKNEPDHRPTVSGPDLGPADFSNAPEVAGYEILRVLGEGGMGVVYLAWQKHPVERQVALKVLKAGMDSKQIVARFESERQALAMLANSNIAHVYDAGTTKAGHSYFVMEYVRGRILTDHCDEYELDVEERLKLFVQACDAIHHAHQKGIIHRDIKPSNILVTYDGKKAVSKIIDFGIAKAVSQPLTERTLTTEQGQLLGTPEYMSPEQADLTIQDIDTRSDIYSLGVVLYELLSGVLPFDPESLREGGVGHILKVIGKEEPMTPSTRLTRLGEKAKSVAERRRTKVSALARRLRSELEWIPLKAMRKDRSQRYRSVAEFTDDIRNYLSGAPLMAGPESSVYRLHKSIRRHPVFFVVCVSLFAGMVIGIVLGVRTYKMTMDRAKRRMALFRSVTGDNCLGGISQRRNTLYAGFSPWMNSVFYQKEVEIQAKNRYYPCKIEGRSHAGRNQYRAFFEPFLGSFHFRSCHGLKQQSYVKEDRDLLSKGYTRVCLHIFEDDWGVTRFQATWIRFGDESPESIAIQRPEFIIPDKNVQIPDELQACSTNLLPIQEAIEEYEKDEGKLPDWLSDLVPDYLSHGTLFCPNDSTHRAKYFPDAKLPCSYSWDMSSLPNTWDPMQRKSYDDWKLRQATFFGDVAPIIRCHHHGSNRVLNLSMGGQIYWSPLDWEPILEKDYRSGDEGLTRRQK
ncbi:MAG: serine/threonine protein kinase [Planctomycetota bacterium]|jgi:serine/threonine protein kinase